MKFLAGLICGVVLASVVGYFICGMQESVIRTMHISSVVAPVHFALNDIVATYDNNEKDLAEAKVRVLRDRWIEYLAVGETHQGLGDVHAEINRLKLEGQAPNNLPGPAHKKAE